MISTKKTNKQTNKQTNKEHNGRRVNRSRDHCCPDCPGALECTEQTCIRTAPHADFATTSLPPHKHKNTSFPSLAVNKQLQAYHPTGVKNYILAAVFFFFLSFLISGFFWKSNTQAYPYTGIIKPQAGRLIGINEQVQAYIPTCRLNSNIQANSHTGSKTTSLLPHRQRGKLQAYSHILAKTTSFPPHRRNTKLQAYSHTGVIQDYKLAATQLKSTKLQAFRHTGNTTNSSLPHRHTELILYTCYPPSKIKKLHSYCLTGPKGKITEMYTNWQ